MDVDPRRAILTHTLRSNICQTPHLPSPPRRTNPYPPPSGRKANISRQLHVDNGDESEAEIHRNTVRAKLALVAPKYSNFETLKRSTSLGGLYHPKPGSKAGKLAILQRNERDNVAFNQVQKVQLPNWCFKIDLSKDSMRDLTLDLIDRKWAQSGGGKGKVTGKGNAAAKKKTRIKLSPRMSQDEKEEESPVVLAMKNFNKKALALNKKKTESKRIKNPKRRLPPSSGATGVRVAISSRGEILSTVKPEFEHLASKPCTFKPQYQCELTNSRRPATTPNPSLNYEEFGITKMNMVRAMKQHRKEVWLEKQKLDRQREENVLNSILAKESRRDVMYQERMHQERQTIFLRIVAMVVRTPQTLGPALLAGREKNRIARYERG